MQEISLDARKQISLDILIYLDEICKRRDIDYFLAYGSLLGAVRHKGFIPWDDDIDIWVPIKDFARLMSVLKDDDKFDLLNCLEGGEWGRSFSKLCAKNTVIVDKNSNADIKRGIAVDIFPLIECNAKDVKKLIKYNTMILRTFQYEKGMYGSALKKMYFKLHYIVKKNNSYYREKLFGYEGHKLSNSCVYWAPSPYDGKDVHSRRCFGKSTIEFENRSFQAPDGYDEILTNLYGDYMTPPPIEKRISNHDVRAYRLD